MAPTQKPEEPSFLSNVRALTDTPQGPVPKFVEKAKRASSLGGFTTRPPDEPGGQTEEEYAHGTVYSKSNGEESAIGVESGDRGALGPGSLDRGPAGPDRPLGPTVTLALAPEALLPDQGRMNRWV